MRRMHGTGAAAWLPLFGVLSLAAVAARADEVEQFHIKLSEASAAGAAGEGVVFQIGERAGYWLGLRIEPLDDEDREEAKLPEGRGLEVAAVVPESPAAKAGLQKDDILLSAGGKPLGSPADLVQIVQSSEGKALEIELLREGKKVTIQATPARRPAGQAIVIREGGDQGAVQRHVIQLQELLKGRKKQALNEAAGRGWQALRAARPVRDVLRAVPFPDDLSVTIKKKGNKPARIKVTRGEKSWKVTENELGELPEDIRGHVARLLGRGPMRLSIPPGASPGAFVPRGLLPGAPLPPGAPAAGGLLLPPPGSPLPGAMPPGLNREGPLQRELRELKRRLDELHEQVEALRGKTSRDSEDEDDGDGGDDDDDEEDED